MQIDSMSYEDILIRESVGDGTIDPDDVCYICEKRDCVCPTEDEPRITRADIKTTGEKIPYFGHMRK